MVVIVVVAIILFVRRLGLSMRYVNFIVMSTDILDNNFWYIFIFNTLARDKKKGDGLWESNPVM